MILAVALLTTAKPMQAQIFDTGYSFTDHFDSLPSYQAMGINPEDSLSLFSGAPFLTATIAWEVWSGLPVGAPTFSGIWQPGDSGYAPLDLLWGDGEGSFRITILAGSQEIDRFSIYAVGPYDPTTATTTVYQGDILPAPVPEPASATLAAFGFAAFVAWRRRAQPIG